MHCLTPYEIVQRTQAAGSQAQVNFGTKGHGNLQHLLETPGKSNNGHAGTRPFGIEDLGDVSLKTFIALEHKS